ncbi:MAG: SDR family oxidoreductase [Candidatus Binatia bacterium]|jgi:NAD(P)-dependent dehydrogenase (short-subunit alcohol dehydrogenase family)|nr:SDR family oxidoreductase [Candidatus Binatia bacterium]
MKLKDKVAIVTGAGRNIGEQIAKLFASEGAKIVIVDMDKGRGQHVVDDLKKDRHEAILSVCNVIKTSEVQELVKKTVEHFGGIDILVNNAAITDHKTILTISEEEFDQVIAVTLKGPFLVAKHVAEQMVKQGRGGRIVNLASTSGLAGRKDAIAYTAAKGGLLNLSRSMAVQLAPHKIRVNCVTPNRSGSPVGEDEGVVGREFKNLAGRLGTPEDQARAVLFMASDDSEFCWGTNLICDGGTMAERL